jgi:hypothetical protein
VTTIRPKVVFDEHGKRQVYNPWDAGYDALD